MTNLGSGSALALGYFDGIHLGHQEVIKICVNAAKQRNIEPLVITFNPHPSSVLLPHGKHELVMLRKKKIEKILKMGARVIELDFTSDFSQIEPERFIKEVILQRFHPKFIVTGFNFHFGYKKMGDINALSLYAKKYGFDYCSVNQVQYDHRSMSSSAIKMLLKFGSVRSVNGMLGESYKITGVVKKGKQLGRELGFPTANLEWPKGIVELAFGVYLVKVSIPHGNFYGVANVGVRPTVHNSANTMLEVHLLKFSENIYEKEIIVEFLDFIRPEKKFSDIKALSSQIVRDVKSANYVIDNDTELEGL